MKVRHSGLAVAGALILLLADIHPATARPRPGEASDDDRDPPSREFPAPVSLPQAPSGYVIVEEDLRSQHRDQPALEFQAAQKDYLDNAMDQAANAIRRGASYVRAEGSRARPDDRAALLSASDALESLSSRVESGKVTSFAAIGPAFARAQRAVAIHRLDLAREAESRADARRTGIHLAVAAKNLRQQLTWQNVTLDHDLKTSLDEVEKAASQLQKRGAVLDAEAGQALSVLEQIIAAHPSAA